MERLAICAIFKDEAPFLLEWLAFHKMIGVDLFFLYDNGSSDGGSELIRRSCFARNVTLIDWPERPGQLTAYNHFCSNFAAKFAWVAFIDLDEFIMPLSGSAIREILLRETYRPFAAVLLQWLVFGPSGHERRPDGLVLENFTLRLPEQAEVSRHVKSLVRGPAITTVGTTPHIIYVSGPTCNARGESVLSYAQQPVACHEVMAINHYFTKSLEDWQFKRRRGHDDSSQPYPETVFADVADQATIEDKRALCFVPRLRAILRP